jgi:hypothetical protein
MQGLDESGPRLLELDSSSCPYTPMCLVGVFYEVRTTHGFYNNHKKRMVINDVPAK